ncbi:Beta-galactosidase C-terminal domain [Micromonospora sp. CA-259024]|uniref:Beta-galactosidase C-terminal domain n=1 Tax=Micromonospora sp. CA-259024 TaxID=3239965 RepID=UPI003D8C73D2
MSLPVSAKVPFGGDYNPEQWPEDVWKQDHRLFDTTRNSFGGGYGWYVAAGLDQAGVSWVVRQLFLLNHRAEPVEVTARTPGVDLLTGDRTETGTSLRLPAYGVVVLREDG